MSHLLTNFDRMSYVRETASPPRRSRGVSDPQRMSALSALARVAIAVLTALAIGGVTLAGEHSNPWLLSWIPAYCCVTNDCCWEVAEQDLTPLPEDKWQVRATGQVRERTNWSPDGKFYRCACDYDNAGGVWIRHIGAHTRCIFVPMRMSSLKTG
jgi:hypothetical protein